LEGCRKPPVRQCPRTSLRARGRRALRIDRGLLAGQDGADGPATRGHARCDPASRMKRRVSR
jgi:hypothetical protein